MPRRGVGEDDRRVRAAGGAAALVAGQAHRQRRGAAPGRAGRGGGTRRWGGRRRAGARRRARAGGRGTARRRRGGRRRCRGAYPTTRSRRPWPPRPRATPRPGPAARWQNVIIPYPSYWPGRLLRKPDAHFPGAPQPPSRDGGAQCIAASREYIARRDDMPGARLPASPAPSGVQACSAGWNRPGLCAGYDARAGSDDGERGNGGTDVGGVHAGSQRVHHAARAGRHVRHGGLDPLAASAAGLSVLEKGGNAFDAAVAAGLVLQVVEPHLAGPGGEVPIIGFDARRGADVRGRRAGTGAEGRHARRVRRARRRPDTGERPARGLRARRVRRVDAAAARPRRRARCAT